jgi:hypothetical protein
VPVTAKLSRKFYETFGDDMANELVAWFNQVDATYRLEFRDLFDTNFARFDAKLEQRLAELRAELRAELHQEIAKLRAELYREVGELRSEMRAGFAGLEGRMLARMGVLEGRFGTLEGHLVRWMFLFWAANLGTTIALISLTR